MYLRQHNGEYWTSTAVATSLLVVATLALVASAFAGTAVAHDDGDGLTLHNSTQPLDEHGEVHTITVDKATADESFYVDVHTDNGTTVNTTNTVSAGTEFTNLTLALDPTIRNDTTLNVAIHAENGTELAAERMFLNVVEAPSVTFDEQRHELDEHMEVHTITVESVAANQPYYVDVHNSSDVTVNTTNTIEAGAVQTDLELDLSPTLKSSENLPVAVHAENGTELAADTARVTVADVVFESQTHEEDQHDEVHTITLDSATAGQSFYVDVHNTSGVTVNTTNTVSAGTTLDDLDLVLSPTLKSGENLTVAVHAENGTELAAQTARVTVEEAADETTPSTTTDEPTTSDSTTGTSDQTVTATSSPTDTDSATATEATDTASESGPGFGVVLAIVGLLGAVLLGRAY